MKRLSGMPPAAPELADPSFSDAVIQWQRRHGRHRLPWQNTRDAYRIWLSEIMLQQTQVNAVIPYYQRFLERFPDVTALATAPVEEVMACWSGLGYYSRARNLHRCAQLVCAEHGGTFPADPLLLAELPGIGRSTAAAIAAFSYGTRAAILDGNVKRVFCRAFGIEGYPGEKKIEEALWKRADALLPVSDIEAYTQGLMDLGATVCTRGKPSCQLCPLQHRCIALATGRVSELPLRKPRKAIPEKHAIMLIVEDWGEVLLEQRPSMGIWGGLLSLPELGRLSPHMIGPPESAIEEALAPFGVVGSCRPLSGFSHVFTHFRLHVTPYRVTLTRRLPQACDMPYAWHPVEGLQQAALPAPVKKLLAHLFADRQGLLASPV